MIYISIIIGCILGALIGINSPVISYTYSSYLSIAIVAALDTVLRISCLRALSLRRCP